MFVLSCLHAAMHEDSWTYVAGAVKWISSVIIYVLNNICMRNNICTQLRNEGNAGRLCSSADLIILLIAVWAWKSYTYFLPCMRMTTSYTPICASYSTTHHRERYKPVWEKDHFFPVGSVIQTSALLSNAFTTPPLRRHWKRHS